MLLNNAVLELIDMLIRSVITNKKGRVPCGTRPSK